MLQLLPRQLVSSTVTAARTCCSSLPRQSKRSSDQQPLTLCRTLLGTRPSRTVTRRTRASPSMVARAGLTLFSTTTRLRRMATRPSPWATTTSPAAPMEARPRWSTLLATRRMRTAMYASSCTIPQRLGCGDSQRFRAYRMPDTAKVFLAVVLFDRLKGLSCSCEGTLHVHYEAVVPDRDPGFADMSSIACRMPDVPSSCDFDTYLTYGSPPHRPRCPSCRPSPRRKCELCRRPGPTPLRPSPRPTLLEARIFQKKHGHHF